MPIELKFCPGNLLNIRWQKSIIFPYIENVIKKIILIIISSLMEILNASATCKTVYNFLK